MLRAWQQATGLSIRDGYGQTETGQLTGAPLNEAIRPGSMGKALPGTKLWIDEGELVVDPKSVPTFFLGYLGEGARRGADGKLDRQDRSAGELWRTGDVVSEDEQGFLHFEGRNDDVIVGPGDRIGPFEVESALVSHPAVAEAAAVSTPDEERGAVVKAVVVLRDGQTPSAALVAELKEHCKRETAPYKYPRVVEFAQELPKTSERQDQASAAAGILKRHDGVDLDQSALRQLSHADSHPGRGIVGEESPIDLVDLGEGLQVGHIDGEPHGPLQRSTRRLTHGLQVLACSVGPARRASPLPTPR